MFSLISRSSVVSTVTDALCSQSRFSPSRNSEVFVTSRPPFSHGCLHSSEDLSADTRDDSKLPGVSNIARASPSINTGAPSPIRKRLEVGLDIALLDTRATCMCNIHARIN
jgi:hypothetical protein